MDTSRAARPDPALPDWHPAVALVGAGDWLVIFAFLFIKDFEGASIFDRLLMATLIFAGMFPPVLVAWRTAGSKRWGCLLGGASFLLTNVSPWFLYPFLYRCRENLFSAKGQSAFFSEFTLIGYQMAVTLAALIAYPVLLGMQYRWRRAAETQSAVGQGSGLPDNRQELT